MNNNLLINKLPQNVTIGGFEVKINSDFRTSMAFEEVLKDSKLSDEEIWIKSLELYYGFIPKQEFINEAIQKMLWFYRCGKEVKEEKESSSSNVDIYSYEHDSELIYGAFLSQYSVNLIKVDYLHWWDFKAMFRALEDKHKISEIMGIRAMDLNKVPKEQREYYKKLKKLYEIPKSEEELKANDAITKALLSGNAEELAKALAPK